jgi:hypothetical protein
VVVYCEQDGVVQGQGASLPAIYNKARVAVYRRLFTNCVRNVRPLVSKAGPTGEVRRL